MDEEVKVESVEGEQPETPVVPKTYTEDEYKGLQRKINSLQEQVRRVDGNDSLLKELKDGIADLKDAQAIIYQRLQAQETYGAQTTAPAIDPIAAIEAKAKAREETTKQARELWQEISEVTGDVGMDISDERLASAKALWASGDLKGAVKTARKVAIASLKEQTKAVKEEETKAIHELARTETSGPSAARGTAQDVLRRYAEGDRSITQQQVEEALSKV